MSTYQEHCAPSVEPNSNLDHPVHGRMRRGLVMAAVGLVVSFGVAANASAADSDCTVNLHITNEKSTAIKVVSIQYDPDHIGGKEEPERLDNKKLSAGEIGRLEDRQASGGRRSRSDRTIPNQCIGTIPAVKVTRAVRGGRLNRPSI